MSKIRDKIARKSNFGGQLKAKLKKFRTNDFFAKGARIQGSNSIKNIGEIKENRSLKVN